MNTPHRNTIRRFVPYDEVGTLTLTEQHLYGAGRIGMRKRNLALDN